MDLDRYITYSPEAEKQLLTAAAKGNRHAYAALYTFFLPKMLRFVKGMAPSGEDAEEVLQDVFLKIWEQREKLASVQSFNAYLYRLVRNQLINLHEHRLVQRKAAQYLALRPESSTPAADSDYSYGQQQEILQRAISQLPEKRRRVYLLSTEQELGLDEIASLMNISRSMVKKQLYAAREAIREYMIIHSGLVALICGLALLASAS